MNAPNEILRACHIERVVRRTARFVFRTGNKYVLFCGLLPHEQHTSV